ncbi:TonB-dependent receptor [Muribaculaceae bacterium Isolate-002 (NCI)]|nr:TonB-dependent receptor [Muribaculaceae bacterium Isolate-002 (NCI)]
MKRLTLFATTLLVAGSTAFADYVCRGTIIDDQGEPLIGASVMVPGSKTGVTTDIDGNFTLKVPDNTKELTIEYIGYKTANVPASASMGTITLEVASQMLKDVVVTQSIARTRKTPVAASSVDALLIENKLGSQEFPEVLKTTPGVWATKDGGGYGDAKINIRGFKSENTGMLVNGIPVNDMEGGWVYWSNWAGLSDVTSMMQVQRGLGASIISVPSVGGTLNITTRSIDAKKGGSVFYGMGNDGMNHIGFNVSTGLMKNGWAVSLMGTRKWGDGYVQGTNFNAYTYFVNVSKRINDAHQLSLTAFGSPQVHYKRSSQDGLSIENWQKVADYMDGESMYRYNPTFGYDLDGQVRSSTKNVYHKPQISLNHIWQIDHKSSLSSAVYVSLASGYGSSGQGRGTYKGQSLSNTSWYGASNGNLNTLFRRDDGTFDYAAIQEMNMASETGSNMIMSKSINSHKWFGLVSTYKNELIEKKLNLTAGIDVRYYIGKHTNEITDLYNGEYFMDDSSRKGVNPANNAAAADPNWKYQKLGVGDVVYRDYDGYTVQEGGFAQLEYTTLRDKLTMVLAGSLNNTTYWRVDRLYYDKEHGTSDKPNFVAGSVKGGANYNIDKHNNVYFNGGYLTRAPFFAKGVFAAQATSNAINPNPVNEKCGSIELGYEFHSPVFTATFNAYYTKWMDKTTTRSSTMNDGQRYYLNMSGVDARHMGLEFNLKYRPTQWLDIDAMLSLGDWNWDSNAKGYYYNELGQPLANTSGKLASGVLAEDHAWSILNQKGRKVGGSAQTTGAIGLTVKPFKGMRIGADWTFSARNYSDYSVSDNDLIPFKEVSVADPWQIPWGNQLDMSASYKFDMAGFEATIFGNVNNLFNYNYVVDAYTASGSRGTWDNAYRVFYSFGRTYSLRLKIAF